MAFISVYSIILLFYTLNNKDDGDSIYENKIDYMSYFSTLNYVFKFDNKVFNYNLYNISSYSIFR